MKLTALPLLLLLLAPVAAAEGNPDTELAERILERPEVRAGLLEGLLREIPNPKMHGFASSLVVYDPEFWTLLRDELAAHLVAKLPEDVRRQVATDLGTPPSEDAEAPDPWETHHELIQIEVSNTLQRPALQHQLQTIGCVVGMIGPGMEKAAAMAGRTELTFDAEAIERLSPVVTPMLATCDCLLTKLAETYGSPEAYADKPESQQLVQKLLADGTCPLPTPQVPSENSPIE